MKNGNIHLGCNWYAAVSVFFFTTESAKKHEVTIQYGDVGRMSGFKTGIKKTRLFELQLALFASSLHWEICCPREQGVNEVPNNLMDVQHVTKFASGLEDFVKRLQQSIIYNSSDTQVLWSLVHGCYKKDTSFSNARNGHEVCQHLEGVVMSQLMVSQNSQDHKTPL